MKKFLLFFALIIISSLKLYAIDGIIVCSIDQSINDKWYKTISESAPHILNTSKVFKKQYFYLSAIAYDFKLNDKKNADVTYSLKIVKPNKENYTFQKKLPLIDEPISNPEQFMLGKAVLKVCFENEDQFGIYPIEITINDNISGKSKTLNTEIELVELPNIDTGFNANEKSFLDIFQSYYGAPCPEKAFSFLKYYINSPLADKEDKFIPIIEFFIDIFKNNEFLYKELVNVYPNQPDNIKPYIIYLINYAYPEKKEFLNSLGGNYQKYYLSIKDEQFPKEFKNLSNPVSLDVLWSEFFATGSYNPIYCFVDNLDLVKYKGKLENFKTSKQTEEDRNVALKDACYQAIKWSLVANATKHPLVRQYLKRIYEYESLDSVKKNELKALISEIDSQLK